MTTHRLFRTYILNCAICALALTVPEFARAQDCFIRLYGNMNANYLEVTVDTRPPAPQSPRPIQPAPVEDQIGVDSVRPCHPCNRCSLGQCLSDNPLFLPQRSVLSLGCNWLSVSVHHRSTRTLSLVSTSRA